MWGYIIKVGVFLEKEIPLFSSFSFIMTSTDNTRKRKQEFVEPKPINTSWTDFVYSSPNSPQQQQQQQQDFDSMFNQVNNDRRHSVSVGEMHFHSFDKPGWNNNELEQVITNGGNSLPSSWSSTSSDNNNNVPIIHRRAMSLRLDNLPIQPSTQPIDMHRASISTASPTTPAFFSPSFLDALKQDDDIMMDNSFENHHSFSDDLIHNFMMNQQQQQSTITPSVISTGDEVNNLTNWLLNQSSSPTTQLKRSSTCSSISTSPPPPINNPSPSPPISIQSFKKQHPSIPEEEDEDMDFQDKNRIKPLDISSRIIQGSNNASIMKPLVQKYLATFQDERKVVIHTSKVAQKSYGTEKR